MTKSKASIGETQVHSIKGVDMFFSEKALKNYREVFNKKAGTWNFPNTTTKVNNLRELLNLLKTDDADEQLKILVNVFRDLDKSGIGDDQLFDKLGNIKDTITKQLKLTNQAIFKTLINYLAVMIIRWRNEPKAFRGKLQEKELVELLHEFGYTKI
jgi:glutaredoxin 2